MKNKLIKSKIEELKEKTKQYIKTLKWQHITCDESGIVQKPVIG